MTTTALDYRQAIVDLETALLASLARVQAATSSGDDAAIIQTTLAECQHYRALAVRIQTIVPPAGEETAHARFVEGMAMIGDAAEVVLGAYAAANPIRLKAAVAALPAALGDGCTILQDGVELAYAAW